MIGHVWIPQSGRSHKNGFLAYVIDTFRFVYDYLNYILFAK